MLVVLTLPDDDDSDRRVDVEITPPTLDAPMRTTFEAPEATPGEFPGFAFFGIDVTLPSDGRWVIDVTSGGAGVSLPLVVSSWTPAPFGIWQAPHGFSNARVRRHPEYSRVTTR
jgi:hypothetical protein